MTKKTLPHITRVGSSAYPHNYGWNNDPFSDPLEKLNTKNAKEKKKYPKKRKKL